MNITSEKCKVLVQVISISLESKIKKHLVANWTVGGLCNGFYVEVEYAIFFQYSFIMLCCLFLVYISAN